MNIEPIDESVLDKQLEPKEDATPKTPTLRRPKWEKKLPAKLTISSLTPDRKEIFLQVELETTDTSEKRSVRALVDSGAVASFIDRDYVRRSGLNTRSISRPIQTFNVDGTPNKAGLVSEVVDILVRFRNHSERMLLPVTGLGKVDMILGYNWLREHNPEVDWQTGEVKMTRCPEKCCAGCREQAKAEKRTRRIEVRSLDLCTIGPKPLCTMEEEQDDEEEEQENSEESEDRVEDGDRIWATGLLPPPVPLRASGTTSQRLAEAFHRNNPPPKEGPGFREIVPAHLHEYGAVFEKTSFDTLPDSREWDHTIELVPGAQPTGCKVYPLAPTEQVELDVFLQENLATGRI